MQFSEIIEIADGSYPEGMIGETYRQRRNCGDTLALFICRELSAVYDAAADDATQLRTAQNALHTAIRELQDVSHALSQALYATHYQTDRQTDPFMRGYGR